ncbi:substance-P receptor-like [Orbicella faveolata]|uniref:substance-P receptor-like n=1 Tax=Orbicella faveolata TaxID=48498 RepID=UPI0009E4C464|nr:substance-P receptor-like [Orbicella faveolata]
MNVSLNATALNSTTNARQVTLFGLVSFLCIAIVLLPIGIAGNLLVIIVVKKKRYLRTKTNFLLANLAASDLMANVLAYTVGIARAFPMPSRTLGLFLCKINSYYPAASFCSILTLTVIALERYNAIVKPLSNGLKFRKRTLRYFIIAIWILSIAAVTPLVYFDEYSSEQLCVRTWSVHLNFTFWTCAIVLAIALPVMVIIYCYFHIIRTLYFGPKIIPMNIPKEVDAQEKKKVIKLSIIVTSIIIIAFTPFSIVRQLEIHGPVPNEVTVLALSLILLSSVLNPFIYAFQSTNYRQAFKETICGCVTRR